MYIRVENGCSAEAMPSALLETYGLACGYAVPMCSSAAAIRNGISSDPDAVPHAHQGTPAMDGDEEQAGLGEVLDGVLRIVIALMCVFGAFALSFYALSIMVR